MVTIVQRARRHIRVSDVLRPPDLLLGMVQKEFQCKISRSAKVACDGNSHSQPGQNGRPRLCNAGGTGRAPRRGQAVWPPEQVKNGPVRSPHALAPCCKVRTGNSIVWDNTYSSTRPKLTDPPTIPSPNSKDPTSVFWMHRPKGSSPLDSSSSHTTSAPSGSPGECSLHEGSSI